MKLLIICCGLICKEVMDVWEEMGIIDYGILLLEKDFIIYNNVLVSELCQMVNLDWVYWVLDYMGMDKDECIQ